MLRYMTGAAALQEAMLGRPRLASAGMRLLTAPPLGGRWPAPGRCTGTGWLTARRPRPSARGAALVQDLAWRLASHRRD